jgi:hypothetical protein
MTRVKSSPRLSLIGQKVLARMPALKSRLARILASGQQGGRPVDCKSYNLLISQKALDAKSSDIDQVSERLLRQLTAIGKD